MFDSIISDAIRYTRKYLTKIDHDNIYISSYFRKIDTRRRKNGRSYLLPLKKVRDNFLFV